ncbi:ATP-binding cassette domain-containing protein [Lachnospiraceae bacterium CLA-AA-H215]|uniref:ATP-binding cassette domain-containing protein n=1 Tax=Hominifimenecus microfluidus TaxID=2885348 RepID=A0AAE3E941_9FIRM|nr:ATP-binding cassette domain-containing protein [Hominifimenecus microfluidus]MCC2230766.1 ATP-binding cassette domain-containing protein [Hominifimenecus microfluidus]
MAEKEIVLDVRNLKQYFHNGVGKNKVVVKAVDDVSFKIARGQTFGLVGESGCGKTTTGRTVIRLYKPTNGEVYFNGKLISGKLNKEDSRMVHQGIQMIFQDPISSLDPRMTIKEIIGEGLIINKAVKNEKELYERVLKMIKLVGLSEDHLSRYPHEFSGGQRQRIGIARVLATNPGLIIADEPISALDVSIQAQVLNLLNELKRELGLTILFIAHNLSVVKYFCDYIGVMNKGRLVEKGTPEEIYANPVHPYTKALLSAIPVPDPGYEKWRGCETYDPGIHDYSVQQPSMHLVSGTHYVLLSDEEMERYAGK